MGDPAGISPELTAKLVTIDHIRARCRLVVIGDRRIFDEGARIAGLTPELRIAEPSADFRSENGDLLFVDLGHLDPAEVERGVASLRGGQFALANYRRALELGRDGRVDSVCFTPFNKQTMRLARADYDDEIAFSAEVVGLKPPASEFDVLDQLWNARVTSHIPLKDVAARLSTERTNAR